MSAATLTVTPDKFTYNIGETITLTIGGDAQGATAYGVFGRLEMSGALIDIAGTSQKALGPGWINGNLETNDDGVLATVEVLDQVAPFPAGASTQTATNPIATVTLIPRGSGLVNVTWSTIPGSGFELTYFDLTSAPGTAFCIAEFCSVPEPGTGALVALGLIALALKRSHRR